MKNQGEAASVLILSSTLNHKSVEPMRDWRPRENIHKRVYWLFLDPVVNQVGKQGILSNSCKCECVWLLLLGRAFCGSFFPVTLAGGRGRRTGAGVEGQCGSQVGGSWQRCPFLGLGRCLQTEGGLSMLDP